MAMPFQSQPKARRPGKFAEDLSPFGISLTHLRANLRDAPSQRLDRMVDAVRFGLALRAAREGNPPPPLDARRLLCAFVDAGVDFVLIGGWAEVLHGSSYSTEHLSVLIDPDEENGTRVAEALSALAAEPEQDRLLPDDVEAPRTLDTAAGRLVVGITAPGVSSYADLRDRAVCMDLGSCRVHVAALEDLEAMLGGATTGTPRVRLEALKELRHLVATTR